VDPTRYLNRPATFAVVDLSNAGLVTQVLTLSGEEPKDMDTCLVTEVTPPGEAPVGAEVMIRCRDQNGPG
jgi:eukaryotic-like serine/threonine-protein kinase